MGSRTHQLLPIDSESLCLMLDNTLRVSGCQSVFRADLKLLSNSEII